MQTIHESLRNAMAEQPMRLAHLLWHGVREQWMKWQQYSPHRCAEYLNLFPMGGPPNPSMDSSGQLIYSNTAGLDFLHMHRRMLAHANHILHHNGQPKLVGWKTLPDADDPNYPVPGGFNFPPYSFPAKVKARWKEFVYAANQYILPANLKARTLNEVGMTIEYGIHNAMHQRFGGYSAVGLRPDTEHLLSPKPEKWDVVEYDSLLDPYSAAVHPLFWAIHCWVDDRITDWETANSTTVDWGTPWMGPMADMHNVTADAREASQVQEKLVHAAQLLNNPGTSCFFRPRLLTSAR